MTDKRLEMPRFPKQNIGVAPADTVEHALWQFAHLVGSNVTHPLDWRRFYRFIVFAHIRRKGWDVGKVKSLLLRYGFSPEKALQMAEIYWHGRCVLRIRKKWSDYSGWAEKGGTCWT